MLFLALKKVQIVKITPGQIPTDPIENFPTAKFPIPLLPPALNAIIKPCQMSCDHSLSQKKNKATKRAVRVEIGKGVGQNLKKRRGGRGGGVGNIGDLDKIVG